ncbi:MAG: hypothetical protein ACFFED_11530 [Candidatus Thorarchaeota archaeon]
MNIKSMYIIKRETGVCMYHKDFVEAIFDPDLISSFISAMTSFFDEANQSISSRARAFEGTDYKILVEFGEWTLGAIAASEDDEIIRERLRNLIVIFEEQFNLLRWVEMDLAVYSRFEKHVISELLRCQITPESHIRQKLNWDLYVRDPEVVSFLKLLPETISVKDAAKFLEMPLEVVANIVANAIWEKAVVLSTPVRPDDIYQTTSLERTGDYIDGVSPETTAALSQLDGETPLAIAAERVKTTDLRRFLEEIAILAERDAVERVSEAQAILVQHSNVLQEILRSCSVLLGRKMTRQIFFDSRQALAENYTWLTFIDLENGVDVEIRSSLSSAAIKSKILPDVLIDGLRALMQFVTKRVSLLIGAHPINVVVARTRDELEQIYPRIANEVQWEQLTA